jgi:hypothetical protein
VDAEAGAALPAGWLPPRLPNSDMLVMLLRGVVKSSVVALFCREQAPSHLA